jgi:UDP-N-acetylmuramate--alanine ligase
MTTHILMETGQRPSYIIGGILRNTGNNADIDDGRVFVIEADEYDNMFHGLRPQIEVITNIEWDHPDFFRTPHEMVESFSHFVGLLPNDGLLVVCADDHTALILARTVVVSLPTATAGSTTRRRVKRGGSRLSRTGCRSSRSFAGRRLAG